MRISHEAIYQALYVQGRGALRRELTACLRTGRALRVPRARSRRRGKSFVTPEIMISERSAEAADRAVPGHWEGDLIIGLGRSAIGTLVERTTRFTMLLHLPRMEGHGTVPRVKNGPALAGHGAEAVRDAIARTITTLPAQLRRSLTWDQGAEMARHADLRIATGLPVYFCEPHSPWQRGTNENTNGLLRQYFPKGTDLSAHSPDVLPVVADALNTRPRKTLGWRTPAEALDQCLQASQTERLIAMVDHTGARLAQPDSTVKPASLIAMVDHTGARLAQPDSTVKRPERQVASAHGPADDAPGVEVEHDGQVQPALCRPDIADVGSPFLVGCRGGEVLVEKVRCDGLVVLAVRRLFELLFPFWRQPISPHQPSHPMASNLDPILGKLVMDPLCTVALAAAPKGCPDMGE